MPSKSKLTKKQENSFNMWVEDGNVIKNSDGTYSTQDALYRNKLKDLDSLKEYFYNEFIKGQYDSYAGGGSLDDKTLVAKAITYIVGSSVEVDTIHFEANKVVFKYKGKNVWSSLSQKLIEDTISMHRKTLDMRDNYAKGGETKKAEREARRDIKKHLWRPQAPLESINRPSEEWERYELPYDTKMNYDFESDTYSVEGKLYNQFKKGGNVSSIEKRVNEINELIELANKNNISVVDSNSTWQSPMKYKPIRYSNGVLYVEYDELDLYKYNRTGVSNWVTKKDKVLKRDMEYDNPLNDIAKMYRKALKEANIDYKGTESKNEIIKEAGFNDEGTSMVMYHEKKGNFIVPKGQVYLWLYDVEDSADKLQKEEFDWVFYPYASQTMAWQSGYIPPLKRIWTKKFQKEHKGSEHLLGVVKAYLLDDGKKLFIDMMSVNPTKKKKGIMSYMIKDLRESFNLTQEQVEFSKLTEEGEKFVSKGKFEDGGDIPNKDKMFQLPLEMVVYVPSTQDVDKVISVDEMESRVNEVKQYLASKFGGYTSSDKLGGYVDSKGKLVNEDIVQVVAFSTKEAYRENKEELIDKLSEWASRWGQEAIGFEFEGDLMYVPQKFKSGGRVKKKNDFYYDKYENGGFVGGDVIKFKYNGQDYTRKVEGVDESGNALVNLFKTEKVIINPADIKEIKKEFDDKSVIVNKIGLSEENADYLLSLSPTFAVWLADAIVDANTKMTEDGLTREEAIVFLNKDPRIITRLRERIRGILDWLQHPTTRKQNLRELSFAEAERKSKEWHDELQVQGGDINFTEPSDNIILKEYPENDNGVKYYWVYIPQSYCDIESRRMGHCGRTSASSLISLRSIRPYTETNTITDSHVTIAYDENDGYIYQAKGKKNQKPAEKYFPYLFDLVKMLVLGTMDDVENILKYRKKEILKEELIDAEYLLEFLNKIKNSVKIGKLEKENYSLYKELEDIGEEFPKLAGTLVELKEKKDQYPLRLKEIEKKIIAKHQRKGIIELRLDELKKEYRLALVGILREYKEKYDEITEKYKDNKSFFKLEELIQEPIMLESLFRRHNNRVNEIKRQIYDEQESEYSSFKGFSSEYQSSEDYGWQDMTNEQIKELYDINPKIFNDFASKFMLYEAGILEERPNTIFTISKSSEFVEDLLNVDRNLRDGFVNDVLAGDIYDIIDTSYSYQYYYDEASGNVDELKPNQYEEVIDRIVEITGYEKELVKENGAKYYLDGEDDEFSADEFDDIKIAIARAMETAETDEYQKYYYEQIESALQELGGVKELNDTGVEIEIDLLDKLELTQISSYMKDLDTESLEDVFWEAQSNGDIELPSLSIDDRYSAYAEDWQDYFEIDNF